MPTLLPERVALLEGKPLKRGGHNPPNGECECCFVEAENYIYGLRWGAHNDLIDPALSSYFIQWNDSFPATADGDADRTKWLAPFQGRLVGTRNDGKYLQRAYLLIDYALRVFLPIGLEALELREEAASLRALDPIIDEASAKRALDLAGLAGLADAAETINGLRRELAEKLLAV